MIYPKKDLIEVLKNLNEQYKLNSRFEKNEISAAEYCNHAHAISKIRAKNIAALLITGGVCVTAYSLPEVDLLREHALITASAIISTAAAINFAAKNFKDVYFETYRDKQYFKSRIINEAISNINKVDNELIGNTFNADDLYNSLIWGNELHGTKTGNIIKTTKSIVASIQEKWSKTTLSFWRANKSEMESNIKNNLVERSNRIKDIIDELNNPDSIENKTIESIQKKFKKSVKPEEITQKIKEINKLAITKATELYNNQSLEIIFLKVVSDYDKGIIHHKLIDMFKELESQHTFFDKNDGRSVENSFVSMSNYAAKMIGGINILKNPNAFNQDFTLADIASKINPNLVSNNKIKFVNFTSFLANQKDSAIKNYIKVKKPQNNQISINKIDIDLLISIKNQYGKTTKEINEINELDKKMKIDEIYKRSKENRNIKSIK
jgi:hypothetical protein